MVKVFCEKMVQLKFYKPEAYIEPYETSMMKLFSRNSYRLKAVTIFTKNSIINVWHGPM